MPFILDHLLYNLMIIEYIRQFIRTIEDIHNQFQTFLLFLKLYYNNILYDFI